MIILAGVSLNAIVGENGILNKSMESSFKSAIAQYKEDSEVYVVQKQIETNDYSNMLVFAGDIGINGCFKSQYQDLNALYDYTLSYDSIDKVTSMDNEHHRSHLAVYSGDLTWYANADEANSNEVKWCLELGLKVFVDGHRIFNS